MKTIEIRDLRLEDICNEDDNGFYSALYELSDDYIKIPLDKAKDIFYSRCHSGIRTIVATIDDYIVGTAALIIEDKFLHSGSKVGHIEDVSVAEKYQRTGIGRMLINELIRIAKDAGCYKCILYCNDDKVEFYKKFNFYPVAGMRLDIYREGVTPC